MEKTASDAFMEMSPWDFDQTPFGWRSVSTPGKELEAAELIKLYILKNKDRILNQDPNGKISNLELMYFHVAQLLAMSGAVYYSEAIEFFNGSIYKNEKADLWNAYVFATIGFLEADMDKIDEAIQMIERSPKEDKRSANFSIVKNFKSSLQDGQKDYMTAYSMPRE